MQEWRGCAIYAILKPGIIPDPIIITPCAAGKSQQTIIITPCCAGKSRQTIIITPCCAGKSQQTIIIKPCCAGKSWQPNGTKHFAMCRLNYNHFQIGNRKLESVCLRYKRMSSAWYTYCIQFYAKCHLKSQFSNFKIILNKQRTHY